MTDEIAYEGWRFGLGFAGANAAAGSFYAAYGGDAFGHPARGYIAAIACAHGEVSNTAKSGRAAAELAIHSLAEGYFGAQRTLSPKRAVNIALQSINAWLFGQVRDDTTRHLAPVSLTALLMSGGVLGVAHAGSCRLYRKRQGVVTKLTRDHVRTAPDGRVEPTRAIGLDLEFTADYAEETAETGDRYLLVSGLADETADALNAAFALQCDSGGGNGGPVAAMVLDILAMPEAAHRPEHLADLPLRPAPREGDMWDGFEIGKTIYRGRYTVLKHARDTQGNRDVVLKIPLPSMLQDEVFTAGFMREAWIGTTVRGNNVARYLELAPDRRSSLYLVLPFYRGETLEQRLNHAPAMPLPDGIGIALKLCEAVTDLAAIEIIHRDIKPENIMLLAGNDVKLLDLGLAYLPGIDMQDAVKPGGTLRYMAPELLQGAPASGRSEVYALGVTIYRMFSGGGFPFGQRESVPLARLRRDLPSWLGRVLERALAAEPAARFADAAALALALNAALINGVADGDTRLPAWSRLAVWRAATLLFAAGFFILLVRALR